MEQTFGTCCHGAGRRMSRTAAVKHAQGRRIDHELAAKGIIARARSWRGLAEEQPDAYKDVNHVVDVVHRANLASKVARMRPIGVVKGSGDWTARGKKGGKREGNKLGKPVYCQEKSKCFKSFSANSRVPPQVCASERSANCPRWWRI
jgi:hypothetical protein